MLALVPFRNQESLCTISVKHRIFPHVGDVGISARISHGAFSASLSCAEDSSGTFDILSIGSVQAESNIFPLPQQSRGVSAQLLVWR